MMLFAPMRKKPFLLFLLRQNRRMPLKIPYRYDMQNMLRAV